MDLDHLRVRPGSRVTTSGLLRSGELRSGELRSGVPRSGLLRSGLDGWVLVHPSTGVVALAADRSLSDLVEQSVVVTGPWDGTAVTVEVVTTVPTPADEDSEGFVGPTHGLPGAADVMGPLYRSGAIRAQRAVLGPLGRPMLLVVAHGAEAVRARLEPLWGPDLHVVESRYTPDELDAAYAWVDAAVAADLLHSVGPEVTDEGVARTRVEVHHVDDRLADLARPLPDGILVVDPLLAPA